jgi:chromosome segregation ATPase
MESVRKLTSSRMSRVGWALAIVALAGAMALSFVFAYSSVGDQQRAAQARAVAATTKKPFSELTATQVSKPIEGDFSKELLKDVRDHVLKDDRVLRVRIFNLNGTLVFSTDAGDKSGAAQIGSQQFRTGSSGGVASLITEPEAAVPSGLAGSSERLYVTFAALRLQSQPKAAAVVEVDQRYAAIEAAAYQLWRPIQLVIGVLILIALLMLVTSMLSWRGRRFAVSSKDGARPAPGFAQGGSTRAQKDLEKRLEAVEESLRTAEQRAGASEREKRQIAERLVTAQEQLELMTAAAKSPKPAKGSDEAVSRRLAELEAERDRMTAEVTRLERELQERGSAPAGENGPSPSSAETGVQERVAELEAALGDANAKAASFESAARQLEEERKVASAELDRAKEEIAGQKGRKGSKSKDTGSHAEAAEQMAKAEERAQQAEERAQQAEERAQQAEERAQQAEELTRQAEEQAKQAQERASESDQRAGQTAEQLGQANTRIEQLEAGSADVERRAVAAEQRVAQLEAVTKQAEERMTQLEGGQRQAEQRAAQADVRFRETEQERTRLSEELERVLAAGSPATAGADDGERAAQLAARVEELEAQRRKDVAELQRVQEALANTQHELATASKQPMVESSVRPLQAVEGMAEAPAKGTPGAGASEEETIATRLSRAKGRKRVVDPDEPSAPQEPAALQEPSAPEEPAASSGGLSLRERLARAAAARHRVSGGEDEAEER